MRQSDTVGQKNLQQVAARVLLKSKQTESLTHAAPKPELHADPLIQPG